MIALAVVAAVCLLCLYCLLPRLPQRPLGPLEGWDYAHRGLWDDSVPENSLAAFRRAAQQGFGIELDVQVSADGELVVFHDDDLSRMCGIRRNVAACSIHELQSARLLNTDETIPTLAEVLREVNGRVPLIVEIKHCPNMKRVCSQTDVLLRRYPGVYCVESFDPKAMRWFRKNRPQVLRGQLVWSPWGCRDVPFTLKNLSMSTLLGNVWSRPDFIAHDIRNDRHPAFLLLRRMKVHTVAWTVQDPETMNALRDRYSLQIFDSFVPLYEDEDIPGGEAE